ncbi:MAG TPA: hypothetical protein VLK23_04090 [Thermodesulfobacteriota bacterium]|nr:hypothetical protein [Thermodesulfobacteriota bacterium]
MDEIGKSCVDCRRLHSFTFPCPHKDNPLILKARFLNSGLESADSLTDEDWQGLKLLCSKCEGFM